MWTYSYVLSKNGRKECNYCHHLVFKDKETEFKYRMNRELIKEKRRKNEI